MKFRYVVGLVLLSFISCQRTPKIDPLSQSELTALKEKSGELAVVFYSPKGETEASKKITVSFNQPMTALESYQQVVSKAPLEISPKVSGTFRWLGSKTLLFAPEDHLPYATEFTVKVPKGTKSLLDKELSADFVFNFSSSRPKIEKVSPSKSANNLVTNIPASIFINQPVQPETLQKSLQVTVTQASESKMVWPVKVAEFTAEDDKALKNSDDLKFLGRLKVIPKKPYPIDSEVTLSIADTLKGDEGSLTMGTAFETSFKIHGPFKIGDLSCTEECYPGTLPTISVNTEINADDFEKAIQIEPALAGPPSCYYARYDDAMMCSAATEPNTTYTLSIAKGLKDSFNQTLETDQKITFKTGSYAPAFYFTGGHGVLEASGSRDYYAYSMNITEMTTRIAELDNQVLAKKAFGFFESGSAKDPLEGLPLILDENKKLNYKKNYLNGFGISLSSIPKGSFVMLDVTVPEVQTYDYQSKLNKPTHFSSILQVTNLGLAAKWSPKNSLVWVTQLSDGKPVKDAQLSILNDKGAILWTGESNDEGLGMAPGLAELDQLSRQSYKQDNPSNGEEDGGLLNDGQYSTNYLFMAKTADDKAFVLNTWNEGFNTWNFGYSEDFTSQARLFKAFLYSERGVYRPGEQVHIKGVVREMTNALPVIPHEEGTLTVINPKGDTILNKDIVLNEFGSFAVDVDLPAEAASGGYSITYATKNDEVETRGYGSFAVEYYRPQEFKVTLKNEKDDIVKGGTLSGFVQADYLFGAPMKGRNIDWDIHYKLADYYPPNQPEGYSWQKAYEEKELVSWMDNYNEAGDGDGKLDDKGQFNLKMPIKSEEEFDEPRTYIWEATVEDVNHQSISESKTVTVHPSNIYLGIKSDSYFAEAGKSIKGQVRAVKIDGEVVLGLDVVAVWKKIEWKSVRKKGFRGVYTYETERTVKDIKTCQLKTTKEDALCDFTPKESGVYLLSATAKDAAGNSAYSSAAVYATGSGYGGWKLEDSHQLTLKKDKEIYSPGDIARILIQSPFEKGYALITQERGGVITKQVQELKGFAPTLEIPIVKDQIPNVYVSVMLVNGRLAPVPTENEDDRGKPSVHVGLINLPVESNELTLTVAASMKQPVYQPGDEASLALKVTDSKGAPLKNAEVTLMIVDQGILRLTGYRLPDPMEYFYSNQGLAVSSSDSRIYLVGKRALAAKMDSEPAGGGIDTNFRSNFVPTAYWNPSILTNDKGEADIQFKLPDNLTSFSVMAVALGGQNQFGSGETEFRTKKDLMIRPALPRFGRSGDQMTVGALVHNEGDKDLTVTLEAAFKGAITEDNEPKQVKVKAHDVTRVNYKIKVEEGSQNIETKFSAKADALNDAVAWTIPVNHPRLLEHRVVTGSTDNTAQEFIKKPVDIYESMGGLDLSLASTPLIGFGDEMKNLKLYPFDCMEQKISKVYPLLISEKLVTDFGLKPTDNWQKKIKGLISDMQDAQLYDGGFKYWPDSWYTSYYLTAYAASFYADALAKGFDVDQGSVARVIRYLQNELARKRQPNYELTTDEKFYMVKALSDLNEPMANWIDTLYNARDQLSLAVRAQLLMMMRKDNPQDHRLKDEIKFIENNIALNGNEASVQEPGLGNVYVSNSNRRTTAIVVDTLLTINPDHPLIEKMITWLVKTYNPNRWVNTQESISVLRAINHYHELKETNPPQFAALVQKGTDSLLKATFTDYNLSNNVTTIDMAALTGDETLTFKKEGQGRLFYKADLYYARRKHVFSIDNGMTISKRYLDTDGAEVNKFVAGNLYTVVVNVVFETDAYNVALEDPVAAGFEPVNPRLQGNNYLGMNLAKKQAIDENFPFEYLVSYAEKRDNAVLAFADYVPKGSYEYIYFVRATTSGHYQVPASRLGEMYNPDIFGQSVSGEVTINEK